MNSSDAPANAIIGASARPMKCEKANAVDANAIVLAIAGRDSIAASPRTISTSDTPKATVIRPSQRSSHPPPRSDA